QDLHGGLFQKGCHHNVLTDKQIRISTGNQGNKQNSICIFGKLYRMTRKKNYRNPSCYALNKVDTPMGFFLCNQASSNKKISDVAFDCHQRQILENKWVNVALGIDQQRH